MRNLSLSYKKSHQYDNIKVRLMVQHAFKDISFVYDENNTILKLDRVSGEIQELCTYENVIGLEFIQLNDCLCFATESGDIVQYNFHTNQCDIEGRINDGIDAMLWSPDQEYVVFVTKANNMILMFSTFDVVAECSLSEKAEKEFMTVGWGKKETQFHGSVGKENRKKAEIQVNEEEDRRVSCCWRGDGEFFAVNYVGSHGRMFKVFSKEGIMLYVSELCANLQFPIAWKPSGLWIAKPEIYDIKYTITLFEKNGLKHNELVLPFTRDSEEVTDLSWNQDSDILAIVTKTNKGSYIVYFYTISNYKWYMKYHLEFTSPVVFNWSQNYAEPKQFHVIDQNGKFSTLNFDFIVNHSSGQDETDESVIAVIEGSKILLTNTKNQIVPPPMCSLEYPLEVPINLLTFIQSAGAEFNSNSFMTVDYSNTITLYRCIFSGKSLNSLEKFKSIQLELINDKIVHALWIDAENILVSTEKTIYLYSIGVPQTIAQLSLEDVIGSVSKIEENIYAAQLIDGSIIVIEMDRNELKIHENGFLKLPEFCEKISFLKKNNEIIFYALNTLKKKLYYNSKEIATEVTSFTTTIDREFLMFTTISELKFIKIDKNPEQVIETRRVERGSKIVALVKDKSQVILQLPRGNLETISPRILSVKIIKKFLDVSNYRQAFDLLRKERINLNLLIDMQPQRFFREMQEFIVQIDNINWINLFLTELKNEDVTQTMYKFCDKSVDENYKQLDMDTKISIICLKMLVIFEHLDPKKYLLPSITCHVKNDNLEKALQVIWDLKKAGGNDKEADDAIKYLLYLIDINVLYNIALGMYDYQLVMFVAQKSQKDPKEYVPFLQELNSMEPAYARYKIDCHLKRYQKAISNIAPLCPESPERFKECIELIKKHSIYEPALKPFEFYENCYQKICILYGDHLRVKGKFLEAVLMYERGKDFKQALASARNILDWRKCLILAKKLNYSESEVQELATKLTQSLIDVNRHKEASEIMKSFGHDKRALIETLISGRLYSEALYELSFIESEHQAIVDAFKLNLISHFTETIKAISDEQSTFVQQKSRLLSLRQDKMRKIQNPQNEDNDDDDMFSDTTSINSQSSRNTAKTFKSSKNRRKHERKLLNLKEGNKFEDIALLDSLWRLVHKVIGQENQHVVRDLIVVGIEMKMDEMAKSLQKSFKDLLLTIKHSLDEIWVADMLSAGKYPETEEEMELYNMNTSNASRMSFDLIKPEQRYKPKMNIIDFEMEMFRDNSKKSV